MQSLCMTVCTAASNFDTLTVNVEVLWCDSFVLVVLVWLSQDACRTVCQLTGTMVMVMNWWCLFLVCYMHSYIDNANLTPTQCALIVLLNHNLSVIIFLVMLPAWATITSIQCTKHFVVYTWSHPFSYYYSASVVAWCFPIAPVKWWINLDAVNEYTSTYCWLLEEFTTEQWYDWLM